MRGACNMGRLADPPVHTLDPTRRRIYSRLFLRSPLVAAKLVGAICGLSIVCVFFRLSACYGRQDVESGLLAAKTASLTTSYIGLSQLRLSSIRQLKPPGRFNPRDFEGVPISRNTPGTWAGGSQISSYLTRFKRITNGTAVANFYCP